MATGKAAERQPYP
jgi:hypothetical protein